MKARDKLKILVCLPTTSQSMKSATAVSVANTCTHLVKLGHSVDLHNIDSAEIVTARDMFANMVLHSDYWDHLLFIDSDMRFDPSIVERMIQAGSEVAGVAYVRRSLNLDQLFALGHTDIPLTAALAQASSFTFKLDWNGQADNVQVHDGFCRAAAVGMGCALISKQALHMMVDASVVQVRKDLQAAGGETCWSFFETLELDGVRLGEDYSFCYRWTALLHQPLMVCIDSSVGHIGSFEYSARYLDALVPSTSN